MRVAVDLHIHSSLSPCADNDMTPNNIVNMAKLKGLDFIAITDHNSMSNVEVTMSIAEKLGIIVIPGIEVETSEEIHVICLLADIENALMFENIVKNSMPNYRNKPNVFGEQLIFDQNDKIIAHEDRLLLTATKISFDDVFLLVKKFNGLAIPAHVDRESHSVISNLGLIPDSLGITTIEFSNKCQRQSFASKHKECLQYNAITSSDAHYLWDIFEKKEMIDVDEKTTKSLIESLSSGKLG